MEHNSSKKGVIYSLKVLDFNMVINSNLDAQYWLDDQQEFYWNVIGIGVCLPDNNIILVYGTLQMETMQMTGPRHRL